MTKFSETRRTPTSEARVSSSLTMNSVTPLGAWGLRRMTSRETPRCPHGTKDSTPASSPDASCAVTCRMRPSAGSPARFSAIEKPRSGSSPRHASAAAAMVASSSGEISDCRRSRTISPARWARRAAWRTGVIEARRRSKRSGSRIASSPIASTRKPCAAYAVAPASLADKAAGTQPYSRASAFQASMAAPQDSGRPMGSPEARLTPAMTR
jgi:hypothetical protein